MNKLESLSKRELEIVNMVFEGLTNKEIANKAFIAEKTVKFHLTNIYKILDIKNRNQLFNVYGFQSVKNLKEKKLSFENKEEEYKKIIDQLRIQIRYLENTLSGYVLPTGR